MSHRIPDIRTSEPNNIITVTTDQQSIIVHQPDNRVVEILAGPMGRTGHVNSGSLLVTASVSSNTITFTKGDGSTFPITVNTGSSGTGAITYTDTANNDAVSQLRNIKIYDYDAVNSVNFNGTNQTLTLILGTPNPPTASIAVTGFDTDRFNKELDSYNVQGSWASTLYTLTQLTFFEESTIISDTTNTNGITSPISTAVNTYGSHTYTFRINSTNPSTGVTSTSQKSVAATLSKLDPSAPVFTFSNTLNFGFDNDTIEYGDTGEIRFTLNYGTLNRWQSNNKYVTASPSSLGFYVDAEQRGTASIDAHTDPIFISGYALYNSPPGTNDPDPIYKNKQTTKQYNRVKSLRIGYSDQPYTYFTANGGAALENLMSWTGTIYKPQGWTDPVGKEVSVTWSGAKYIYIVMDSQYTLNSIIQGGSFQALTTFVDGTTGGVVTDNGYRIYATGNLLGVGGTITTSYQLS
jgi:hypothetical protein